MTDDGFSVISAVDTARVFGTHRGPAKPLTVLTSDGFTVLDESQTDNEFRLVTPDEWKAAGPLRSDKRHSNRVAANRPVCFIDGEGANEGKKVVILRKGTGGLTRTVQKQNYALLNSVYSGGEYRYLVGENNTQPLGTKECLDFIMSIPRQYIVVGYGLGYDVEKILSDLTPHYMNQLIHTNKVYWHGYRIMYIPGKIFSVSDARHMKRRKQEKSKTVYDILGFFQTIFSDALEAWHINLSEEEMTFLKDMKADRENFGPITPTTIEYSKLECTRGIELFERVRAEYTNLGLTLSRPVGAGSIASAMFHKHGLDDYLPKRQLLPTEVMLQSFIGGRFDISKIGFVGDAYQSDINSAYPHIARSNPCLAHCSYEWTTEYKRDSHSLWLVRWHDNDNRWSPFPYRTDNGHIRYYSSGMGYYYGDEVTSALQLDSDIEILGGYAFIPECDHQPFQWIEYYYQYRQELLKSGNFGEKIIKLGLNSLYGKLAQTKGHTPRYQNLIWAGMITSGTRAMLMKAIAEDPANVIQCATDAVISFSPPNLRVDATELGAWKQTKLEDLLLLGNGLYHSRTQKHGHDIQGHRGFRYLDWETVRNDYASGNSHIATKREFVSFSKALHNNRLEERGTWMDEQIRMTYAPPDGKLEQHGWLWPGANETPQVVSAPLDIPASNLRIPGVS